MHPPEADHREITTVSDLASAAADRDLAADDRDQRGEAHDRESTSRDERADSRDERAEARESAGGGLQTGAVADRSASIRDRSAAAGDRAQSAADRTAAASDRHLSATERAISSVDGLTGAYRRDSGIVELIRETDRAARTKASFVLGVIDVDNLKATNDSLGHPAGDELLRAVADAIRDQFRSYDLLVRFGGDEFVCGLPGVPLEEAAERLELANAGLAERNASISFGLAELEPGEPLEDLIRRADARMYEQRQRLRFRRG